MNAALTQEFFYFIPNATNGINIDADVISMIEIVNPLKRLPEALVNYVDSWNSSWTLIISSARITEKSATKTKKYQFNYENSFNNATLTILIS